LEVEFAEATEAAVALERAIEIPSTRRGLADVRTTTARSIHPDSTFRRLQVRPT